MSYTNKEKNKSSRIEWIVYTFNIKLYCTIRFLGISPFRISNTLERRWLAYSSYGLALIYTSIRYIFIRSGNWRSQTYATFNSFAKYLKSKHFFFFFVFPLHSSTTTAVEYILVETFGTNQWRIVDVHRYNTVGIRVKLYGTSSISRKHENKYVFIPFWEL